MTRRIQPADTSRPKLYELEFCTRSGETEFVDIRGRKEAASKAIALAEETGHHVVIRSAPCRRWRLLLIDLDSHETVDTGHLMTRRESMEFWREWDATQERATCLFWPTSSPFPTALTASADSPLMTRLAEKIADH